MDKIEDLITRNKACPENIQCRFYIFLLDLVRAIIVFHGICKFTKNRLKCFLMVYWPCNIKTSKSFALVL